MGRLKFDFLLNFIYNKRKYKGKEKNMSFEILKRTLENHFLNKQIEEYHKDGRINSIMNEKMICEEVKKVIECSFPQAKINIDVPERYWYDMSIIINNKFYPINIKITSGKSADNVSSKAGMMYALTGINKVIVNVPNTWEKFNKMLISNLKPGEYDYYFIIYFKDDNKFLFTSLKRLEKIIPNGNNLLFQCKWRENFNSTTRTEEEQIDYIMETFYNSFIKKTSGLRELIEWSETRK